MKSAKELQDTPSIIIVQPSNKKCPKKLFNLSNRYLNPFKSLIVPRQIGQKMQVTQWSRDSSNVDNGGYQQNKYRNIIFCNKFLPKKHRQKH